MNRNAVGGGILFLLPFLFIGAAFSADPSLIDKARKEGKLVLYGSMPVTDMNQVTGAFEKKFPGVKVEYLRMSGRNVLERILLEQRSGKHLVDVVDADGPSAYSMRQKGLLAKFYPSERNMYGDTWKDEGYWTAWRLSIISMVYNKRMVAPPDIPRRYADLLNPRWKRHGIFNANKFIFPYMMIDLYGKEKGLDFLKKLSAQAFTPTRGSTLVIQQVAAGEAPIGIPVNADGVENIKEKGGPVDWPQLEDYSYADLKVVGAMAGAPQPNAARLFVDFVTSKEGQTLLSNLDQVVAHKGVELKVTVDKAKLRPIDPKEAEAKLDYYKGLVEELFVGK
jgi:iron(III) transport system substrate-binding protein